MQTRKRSPHKPPDASANFSEFSKCSEPVEDRALTGQGDWRPVKVDTTWETCVPPKGATKKEAQDPKAPRGASCSVLSIAPKAKGAPRALHGWCCQDPGRARAAAPEKHGEDIAASQAGEAQGEDGSRPKQEEEGEDADGDG
ncbi:putative high mobility group protein B1-like 1 [Ictidomys tridecemlineatus]|nr:putative high mobility group protein B1-like 1 [Ictidomys tridecemlineatus]